MTATAPRFTGFPNDALAFFAELASHNERPWWQANKDRFESSVREPMRVLLDELEPSWGAIVPFRMNRDTRFSKDKSPYKTAHAAMGETDGGSSHYLQLSASGLFVGAGMYHLARDQLERFREAVGDDRIGTALEAAIVRVGNAGLAVTGGASQLATAPRGWPRDHPRIELLRWTGAIANRDFGDPSWLQTRRVVKEVAKVWSGSAPLVEWLDRHVGPTELPPR